MSLTQFYSIHCHKTNWETMFYARTPFVTPRFMVIVWCIISPSIFQFLTHIMCTHIQNLLSPRHCTHTHTVLSDDLWLNLIFIHFPAYFQFCRNINHLGCVSAKCLCFWKSINVIKTFRTFGVWYVCVCARVATIS